MKIDEAIAMISHIKDYIVDNQGDKEYGGALDMAIEALEAQRWIPVSERLPEKDKSVFVFTDCGETDFAYIGYRTGHWFTNGMLLIPTVTHWMPLPEPPETTREEAGHWDGIAPEQEV